MSTTTDNEEDVRSMPCSAAAKPVKRTIWVGVNGWGIAGSFQISEKYTMSLMKWLAKRALARKKQPNEKLNDRDGGRS